jgi:hypothetical protein
VHVFGHQHAGVNGAAVGGGRSREPIAIAGIVVVDEEDCPTIVAALDDVQGLVRQEIASQSRYRSVP